MHLKHYYFTFIFCFVQIFICVGKVYSFSDDLPITKVYFTFKPASADSLLKWNNDFQSRFESNINPLSNRKFVLKSFLSILPISVTNIADTFYTQQRESFFIEDLEELRVVLLDKELYSSVEYSISKTTEFEQEAEVILIDRSTTTLKGSFYNGGGITVAQFGIYDPDFSLTNLSLQALYRYRTENSIGSDLGYRISQDNLFTLPLTFTVDGSINSIKTKNSFTLSKPLYNKYQRWSGGLKYENESGSDFFFNDRTPILSPVSLQRTTVWGTWNYPENDQFLVTILYSNENINRGNSVYTQAFDNTSRLLFGVSSLKKNLLSTSVVHKSLQTVVTEGGWGTAILGRVFAPNNKSVNYIGGQAERTIVKKGLYINATVSAGSGFDPQAIAAYTYQDFFGLLYGALSEDILIVSRIHQQKVWNWQSQFRQLILDNESGLRGYQANNLIGENRAILNLELRYIPSFSFGFVKANPTVFFDGGTVFNAVVADAKFHHSIGVGLRFFSTTESSEKSLFRIDGIYNTLTNSFGLQFSVDDLFRFPTASVRLPTVYGLDIDLE